MLKQPTLIRCVCLALLVGTGFGVIWGTAASWCVELTRQAHESAWQDQTLLVRLDGNLLIETRSGRDYYNVTFQTLDGVKVEIKRPDWLTPASPDYAW